MIANVKSVLKTFIQASVVLALLLSMVACGWFDRQLASATGGATKTCVDGVSYLQFTSGATVQVDREGKPVACES